MEYTGFFPGAACCHLIELGHPIKRLPSSAPEQFQTLEQKTDFDDGNDYDTRKERPNVSHLAVRTFCEHLVRMNGRPGFPALHLATGH